ncbi:hypothetical protein ACOMHN_061787 [Nucella lapillus]
MPGREVTLSTGAEPCEDNIGYGMTCEMLPNFCSSVYAQPLCRRSCKLCPTEDCQGQVAYGMTCEMLSNFYASKYAPLLYKRSCKFCNSSSPTEAPTAPSSTFPPWTEKCLDRVTGVLTCPVIPNVCDDQYGRLVCRKNCGVCSPTTPTERNPNAVTSPPISTSSQQLGGCTDHIVRGAICWDLPTVCSDPVAKPSRHDDKRHFRSNIVVIVCRYFRSNVVVIVYRHFRSNVAVIVCRHFRFNVVITIVCRHSQRDVTKLDCPSFFSAWWWGWGDG